jgi:SAM-dependent methyltransferase
MFDMKQPAKSALKRLGMYEFAHQLWIKHPDWQSLCLNSGYRICQASDGLPIPDTHLIDAVILSKEVAWFLHSGRLCSDSIRYALLKNGYKIEDFGAILDFGCGCGRVIRHWNALSKGHRIYGTDINPELIAWDQKHLNKIADFRVNGLEPPLNYPDGLFDFIYAISVFTHLTEELQYAWIDELRRVLKLGGLLMMTVHGESRFYQLSLAEQRQFSAGSLVVKNCASPGSNSCGAYHPEFYVRNCLVRKYEVVDFIPRGLRDADQDIYLFQKYSN